jgi:hypothetical protein
MDVIDNQISFELMDLDEGYENLLDILSLYILIHIRNSHQLLTFLSIGSKDRTYSDSEIVIEQLERRLQANFPIFVLITIR